MISETRSKIIAFAPVSPQRHAVKDVGPDGALGSTYAPLQALLAVLLVNGPPERVGEDVVSLSDDGEGLSAKLLVNRVLDCIFVPVRVELER